LNIKSSKKYLAVDFGASSGKALVACFDGKSITMKETYRFDNRPVYVMGQLYWDILRLFLELKRSISKTVAVCGSISAIGVDTWGIDFGLLDINGRLMENPVHYRDKRTESIGSRFFEIISENDLYLRTGVQVLEINTLFQLYSMVLSGSEPLKNAEKLLMIGDLLNYFLTGKKILEHTGATTTQLYDQQDDGWDLKIIELIGISPDLFLEVVKPGIVIDNIKEDIGAETGCGVIPVCLSAYDTSSEIASIPVRDEHLSMNWAYFCCGTWAMSGIVATKPIINEKGLNYGFGNEGGIEGNYNFLKNIVGLWVIQQCRRKWSKEQGREMEWDHIVKEAIDADETDVFIDVNEEMFNKEIFDMPGAIKRFCSETSQPAPETIGEYSRCAYQSLVLAFTSSIRQLEQITGNKIEIIYMVGGGARNRLLCQWTADSLDIPLIACPVETTATGNILLQMVATGEARDMLEAKEILINSIELDHFEPSGSLSWKDKFEKYLKVLKMRKDNFDG